MSGSAGRLIRRLVPVLGAAIAWACAADSGTTFSARVVGVTDGDTITVLRDDQPVQVRLEGIDCPERGQDFGTQAKEATSSLLFGKTVRVEVRAVDRYERLVGRVYVEKEDVSLVLVEVGLAWHYRRYSSDQTLANAEERAREAGRGLWSQVGAVPPWEFRHGSRVTQASDSESRGAYHGNVKSHVFHGPSCQHYDCKNCTIIFETREEAIEAGYRPAGGCNP